MCPCEMDICIEQSNPSFYLQDSVRHRSLFTRSVLKNVGRTNSGMDHFHRNLRFLASFIFLQHLLMFVIFDTVRYTPNNSV